MKTVILIAVMLTLAFSSVGCNQLKVTHISENNVVVTDFAVRLLQNTFKEEENTLISPISVLSGLSLVANGVEGDSLSQIEEVVGLSVEELNEYIYSYTHHLSKISDKDNKLYLANSLWINKDKNIKVSDDFLQVNETYCKAAIFNTSFDQTCIEYTNNWINDQTEELVNDIMDDVPENSLMYLANSLTYEGIWPSRGTSGGQCEFKSKTGTTYLAGNIMDSREDFYLEDNNASGFVRYFEHGKYAFAVLLPNEDTDISTYIQGLTGEKLYGILSNPKEKEVDVWMPLFSFSSKTDMKNALMEMGIEDIFDKNLADFSGLGHIPEGEGLQIDRFFYKTSIDIDVNGMNTDSLAHVPEYQHVTTEEAGYTVDIERPFIIVLMDCENNIPLLIGAILNVE